MTANSVNAKNIVGSIFSDQYLDQRIGYVLDLGDGHLSLCYDMPTDFVDRHIKFDVPQFPSEVPLSVRFKASDVFAYHPVGRVTCTGREAVVTFYGSPKIHDQLVFPSSCDDDTLVSSLLH